MQSRKERHQHEIKNAELNDGKNYKNKRPNKNKRGRKKRNLLLVLLLIIVIIGGAVFGGKMLLPDKNAALDPSDTRFRSVTISSGSTPQQMGQQLEKAKIIKDADYFYKYVSKHGAQNLQAGDYVLSPSQTIPLIVSQLSEGPTAEPKLSKGYILVRVGDSNDTIINKINKQTDISSEKLKAAFDKKSVIKQMSKQYPELLKGIDGTTGDEKLLNYVFPAAYNLNKDKTADEVVNTMLSGTDKLMQPYYSVMKKDGLKAPGIIAILAVSGKAEFEHRRAFIKKIAPYAEQLQKKYGILASISIAQAAHESNWDDSDLSSKYNNFYGVKSEDKDNSVVLSTKEYVDGKETTQKARFAVYGSWKDSMLQHTQLLLKGTDWNADQYKDVIKAKNYKQAAQALYDNHYATDINYTKLLTDLIETWNLQRYDK